MIIPNLQVAENQKMTINLKKKTDDEGTYTFEIRFENPLYKEEKTR